MAECVRHFDDAFLERASNPDNYSIDSGLHRPPTQLGYDFGDFGCPTMQASMFPVQFGNEHDITYLPWASKESFYDGDKSPYRITHSTHYRMVREMRHGANNFGYTEVDLPQWGYLRPVDRDSFDTFFYISKCLSNQATEKELDGLARLSLRLPKLTMLVGSVLIQQGELSELSLARL